MPVALSRSLVTLAQRMFGGIVVVEGTARKDTP